MKQSLRPATVRMVRVERRLDRKILVQKQKDTRLVLYCGTFFGIAKRAICAMHHEFL
jgi:hypothetical protein